MYSWAACILVLVSPPAAGGAEWPDSTGADAAGARSEEHTSELQSQPNLVCRLLLEKKSHPSADGGPGPVAEAAPFRQAAPRLAFADGPPRRRPRPGADADHERAPLRTRGRNRHPNH